MLTQTQQTGIASEYLVCADLALRSLHAVPNVFEHCEYDVVADAGDRLIKIQVKGALTINPRGYYRFDLRKDSRSIDRKRDYKKVDLFAFVAMDQRKIIYLAPDMVLGNSTKTFTPLAMAQGDDEALRNLLNT